MMDYMEQAQAMRETLIAWRRQLHQHPEVGENLPYTKSFIAQKLTEMGLRYQEIDRSGLSVVLGNPEKGPCMLVRCDMDGLPIEEKTGLPYASANGCMHACGHDMHTAMLLGTAQLLKQRENELCGCVKLLWQPAEETMTGAQLMIAGGVMENPHVDAAITIHCDCMSAYRLGDITILNRGITMASNDINRIDVEGVGSHGAFPEQGADPILAAAAICLSLQEILSREVSAADRVVLTQGSFHAGSVPNAIPSHACVEGTVRTFDKNIRARVLQRMEQIVGHVGSAYRCKASLTWSGGCQPLLNDPEICDSIQRSVQELLGEDRFVVEGEQAYASEDFSNFLDMVPGAQMFLVVGSTQSGARYAMHNPCAVFDDAQLPVGSAVLAHVASRWLEESHKA